MIDNISCLDANLDYAERMVRGGYGTAEQAVQICGVKLSDLLGRLAQPTKPAGPPTPNWRRFLA